MQASAANNCISWHALWKDRCWLACRPLAGAPKTDVFVTVEGCQTDKKASKSKTQRGCSMNWSLCRAASVSHQGGHVGLIGRRAGGQGRCVGGS